MSASRTKNFQNSKCCISTYMTARKMIDTSIERFIFGLSYKSLKLGKLYFWDTLQTWKWFYVFVNKKNGKLRFSSLRAQMKLHQKHNNWVKKNWMIYYPRAILHLFKVFLYTLFSIFSHFTAWNLIKFWKKSWYQLFLQIFSYI